MTYNAGTVFVKGNSFQGDCTVNLQLSGNGYRGVAIAINACQARYTIHCIESYNDQMIIFSLEIW